MRSLTILVLCGAISAVFGYGCEVGGWTDWSSCSCPRSEPVLQNIPLQNPPVNRDSPMMPRVMKLKQQSHAKLEECRDRGECPGVLRTSQRGQQACVGGMSGEYPCSNVDLMSQLSIFALGAQPWSGVEGNDIWGWSDPGTGDDYAIVGTTHGTSFVRVSDPANPEVLVFVQTSSNFASTWRDIKVIGNYAYIVSEAQNHYLQIYELTQLRSMSHSDSPPIRAATKVYSGGFRTAHNIVANPDTNYIYAVGANTCSGGLDVYDVSDPLNPVRMGCFSADGYTHDAECVIYSGPDAAYQGKEICFCYNEDTLTIVDVSDKFAMNMISRVPYNNAQYTHQGWLSENQDVLLLDDELDEYYATNQADRMVRTLVWDVTSLANPQLSTEFRSPQQGIDHNMYTKGNHVYQSNYGTGLRILELSGTTLTQVAFFDVHPENDVVDFVGTWSNYPYFQFGASDIVAVSSIERGLFLLKPNMAAMEATAQAQRPTGVQERSRKILGGANESQCPATHQIRSCSTC